MANLDPKNPAQSQQDEPKSHPQSKWNPSLTQQQKQPGQDAGRQDTSKKPCKIDQDSADDNAHDRANDKAIDKANDTYRRADQPAPQKTDAAGPTRQTDTNPL